MYVYCTLVQDVKVPTLQPLVNSNCPFSALMLKHFRLLKYPLLLVRLVVPTQPTTIAASEEGFKEAASIHHQELEKQKLLSLYCTPFSL